MISFSKATTFGLSTIIGIDLVRIGNRIIRNEKKLKNREVELTLQLEIESKTFK